MTIWQALPIVFVLLFGAGGSATPPAPVKKFDHEQHRKLTPPVVSDKNCASCHSADAKGTLSKPGADGHQPCLSSGCHAKEFLGIGERVKKSDPARFAHATAFCRGNS